MSISIQELTLNVISVFEDPNKISEISRIDDNKYRIIYEVKRFDTEKEIIEYVNCMRKKLKVIIDDDLNIGIDTTGNNNAMFVINTDKPLNMVRAYMSYFDIDEEEYKEIVKKTKKKFDDKELSHPGLAGSVFVEEYVPVNTEEYYKKLNKEENFDLVENPEEASYSRFDT